MLLIILVSFITSEEGIYHIKSSKRYFYLSSFGFRSNSNFSYKIYSNYFIKLNTFLLTGREFQSYALKYIYNTCNNTNFKIARLNKTFDIPNNFFSWSDNIKIRGVYYPVILICSKNYSNIEIHYKYNNSISLIDFRNDNNSIIYLIFTLLNLFIGILWLTNTFIYSKFSIPLHQLFAIVPFLKAISNSLIAFEWEKRKYIDKLTNYEILISMFFSTSYCVIFMYSTSLAFAGWCIFRKIKCIEKVKLFLSAFLIVFGMKLENYYVSSYFGTIFKICGLFWYSRMNSDYLVISLFISEESLSTERMKMKVKLVQNFNFTFIFILIFIVLIEFCAVYVGVFQITCDVITEIGFLILEVVIAFFFFLNDNMRDMDCDDNYMLLFLNEPEKSQFVFLNSNEHQQNISD